MYETKFLCLMEDFDFETHTVQYVRFGLPEQATRRSVSSRALACDCAPALGPLAPITCARWWHVRWKPEASGIVDERVQSAAAGRADIIIVKEC